MAVVGGLLTSSILFLLRGIGGSSKDAFRHYRANLGRRIFLGLEFLIASNHSSDARGRP
ncbi:MAG: DUF1622 domain-containing protein [Xanthobacteraceae bacterium]|nr:DUF1622 domain-containing protein [Xanthobacteraceae bacterium]